MRKASQLTVAALILATTSAVPATAQQQQQMPPPSPEEIETLRKELSDRQAAEFSSPEEIEAVRRRQLEQDRAEAVTGYSNTTMRRPVSRTIDLIGDGKGTPYRPQGLTLWADIVTSVSFFDHQGEAWPIDNFGYDMNRISVNNEGCEGNEGLAKFEGQGNVLTVMPCKFWTATTLQVLLEGETRPLTFDVRSGSEEAEPLVDAAVAVKLQSDVSSPYGKTRVGELENSWVNPSARAIRIDPIDTRQDKSVTPILVAPGVTTDVSFMDGSNQSWPIEEIVFPPGVVAINGPCEDQTAGLKRLAGKDSSTFYMTSCSDHRATIGVRLKGRAGALSLMTVPAQPRVNQPDGTISVTVPGVSPVQVAHTVASASAPGRAGGSAYGAFNHDRYLDDFLMGTPPQGARRAHIFGGNGVEGWFFDGALYLRGSFEVVNPAFDANGSSSDGTFKVYKYGPPVSRILAMDLRGREFTLNIE
jgi:hypothetical protein